MNVTLKDLENTVKQINVITKSPLEPYTKATTGKRYHAQVGNYHLDGAYGGWSLERMMNESGGVEDVFSCGHVPKPELYRLMQAFIKGLESK